MKKLKKFIVQKRLMIAVGQHDKMSVKPVSFFGLPQKRTLDQCFWGFLLLLTFSILRSLVSPHLLGAGKHPALNNGLLHQSQIDCKQYLANQDLR